MEMSNSKKIDATVLFLTSDTITYDLDGNRTSDLEKCFLVRSSIIIKNYAETGIKKEYLPSNLILIEKKWIHLNYGKFQMVHD